MKKKYKRTFGRKTVMLAAVLAASLSLQAPVMADTLWEDVAWDMQESQDIEGDYAEDIEYGKARGEIFNYGSVTIKKQASNKVSIAGNTMAHKTCDKLLLYMYLERKVGGTYTVYKNWQYSNTNAYELSRGLTLLVPSGYYYRLRGYHVASKGDIRESRTTLTDGIYIG